MAMIHEKALLPLYYNPPVQYFTKFLLHREILLEKHSNYNRQSYLNRCIILSSNGPLPLTIPVIKGNSPHPLYSEVTIDYTKRWNSIHLRAIESAYRNAPFFIYYSDQILDIYEKTIPRLWDWNLILLQKLLAILKINTPLLFTEAWEEHPENKANYRTLMHPKPSHQKRDDFFRPVPYYQVFSNRYGFVSNLSILDLIFNTGPESYDILKASIELPE